MSSSRQALLSVKGEQGLSKESAVSSGSTLLNLACTERPDTAFSKGGYYYLVGDSMSGKTWLSMSCFAEACRNPAFKDYRLIFDDVEGGAQMDVVHYFGKEVARRLEPPAWKNNLPVMSDTVESFYYHIFDLLGEGRPFIYVLDSQDALTSTAAETKLMKQKKASEEGQKSAGSYGDGKAKYHSENIRIVVSKLRKTGSILIVIGQTRDNIGFGAMFEPRTRAGGKALRFYADLEMWSSVGKKIKRVVRGNKRTIGGRVIVEVRKNRVTGKVGKDRSVILPIYYSLGIDDVGACVDYLVAQKHWQQYKGTIDATELKKKMDRMALIRYIEERNFEVPLSKLVAKVWRQVEAECVVHRKPRYT